MFSVNLKTISNQSGITKLTRRLKKVLHTNPIQNPWLENGGYTASCILIILMKPYIKADYVDR